jgi:hypothetical protein
MRYDPRRRLDVLISIYLAPIPFYPHSYIPLLRFFPPLYLLLSLVSLPHRLSPFFSVVHRFLVVFAPFLT